MLCRLSQINFTGTSRAVNKSDNLRISCQNKILRKDTFTPSFKGYESPLIDYLRSKGAKITLEEIARHVTPGTINLADKHGNTPLHVASGLRVGIDVISHLIENGARVNLPNNDGFTPLHSAAISGDKGIMRRLLQAGADIEHKANNGYETPLVTAITEGTFDGASYLLMRGACAGAKNEHGQSLLHLAAKRNVHRYANEHCVPVSDAEDNLISLVSSLADSGNNIHSRDNYGRPPIFYGAQNSPNIMRHLLDMGADVGVRDIYGKTPLHFAVVSDCPEGEIIDNIHRLVRNGADLGEEDYNGRTALYRASKTANYNVKRYLLCEGASRSQAPTYLPSLGNDPTAIKDEARRAGLDKLPFFVDIKREDSHLTIRLPESRVLPPEKCRALYEEEGDDVLPFADHILSHERFEALLKQNKGARCWRCDTLTGAARLAEVLCQHFRVHSY